MGLRYIQPSGDQALTILECCQCAVTFAITQEFERRRRKDHASFYCPNGHTQGFYAQTAEEKRIKQLEASLAVERERADREKRSREWAESRAKGANIAAGKAKAAARRLEHRVNCGVCPHCHRTFKQLAAHMKHKHPEQR